jgi:hypothetical protein
MTDKAFGVGQAISSAVQDLEERLGREARERQEWEEAVRVISKHIADYLGGGPDLEAEDIEIGRKVSLDLEVIGLRWKVARKKAKARDAAKLKAVEEASFFKPEVQPSIVDSKTEVAEPKGKPDVTMETNERWELVLFGEWRNVSTTFWTTAKTSRSPCAAGVEAK